MKSEHRRELHANELEKLTEAVGKFFEKHGKVIIASLLGVVVVVIGVMLFLTRGTKAKEQGSAQLVTAGTSEDYLTVADNHDLADIAYTPAARVRAAELQLKPGIELYFRDSDAGRKAIEKAVSSFEEALQSDKLPSLDRQRALYGLAVAKETLSGRDTSAAINAYKKLLADFPETFYKDIAARKVDQLKSEDAKEFYAFLSTQQRKPGDLKTPGDMRGLRAAHGGRDVTSAEKPVELPGIPPELANNLDDPEKVKKPKTKQPPEKKKDAAKPFPTSSNKTDKKPPAKTKGKPTKTPANKQP